jgi:hypothetical protein
MDYSILVRLIVAHFLSDFVLQTNALANNKDTKGFASWHLYAHILFTGLIAMLVIWDASWLFPIFIITGIHLVVDGIKGEVNRRLLNLSSPGYLFVVDQFIHITTIISVWAIASGQASTFYSDISCWIEKPNLWLIILAYTAISIPTSVVIGKMTQKWNRELNEATSSCENQRQVTNGTQGLENAGKWIGIVERILILTFVLTNQISAIGFMLAAKSVFRIGDLKDSKDQKKTECINIGTFLNFLFSIFIGIPVKYSLR